MSVTRSLVAHAPKRQRGHLRVAAIMEAGADVFMEKGYDGATMTEIAERSGTAIASLYRFFPSKEMLADALLLQFANHALDGFAELRERANGMSIDDLAGALIAFRLELQSQRRLAIDLADARGGSNDQRLRFRNAMLGSLAGILRSAIPALTKTKSEAMAEILLHVLKAVSIADRQKAALRRAHLSEIKDLVRAYLVSARDGAH